MEVLRVLTWIYAGVLVLALAASLVAIWMHLRRIAAVLQEVREALAPVVPSTEPLGAHLDRLSEPLARLQGEWTEAERRLARADEHLGVLLERLGRKELTR